MVPPAVSEAAPSGVTEPAAVKSATAVSAAAMAATATVAAASATMVLRQGRRRHD
jgi:hypothetical protein